VRRLAGHIKGGTFATVIRAYLSSPKFDSLAKSTRVGYRYLLGLAEQPARRRRSRQSRSGRSSGTYCLTQSPPALRRRAVPGAMSRGPTSR
jgi:hypothetical protein